MLTRRSFLPSFFGGAAAALAPVAALAIPTERTGYQRLTADISGVTKSYCVRLTESQLPEYQSWLMGLCGLATMIKSTDEANPENALSLDEVKAAVDAQAREAAFPGEIEDHNSDSEYHCDRCGWCDDIDDGNGGCYNCGA